MNPYLYCGGDPVNYVDPSGLLTVSDTGDHWAQGMVGLIEAIAGTVVQSTGGYLLAMGVAAFSAGAGLGTEWLLGRVPRLEEGLVPAAVWAHWPLVLGPGSQGA